MNDKKTFFVTYEFVNITREELERVLSEIDSELGIFPVSIESK